MSSETRVFLFEDIGSDWFNDSKLGKELIVREWGKVHH
jgi:hypothetical protein